MYCTKCGTRIDDAAGFCGACGMPVFRNLTPEKISALEVRRQAFAASQKRICPRCKSEAKKDARFCVVCGSALETRRTEGLCQSCGAPKKPGERFCSCCGSRLNER